MHTKAESWTAADVVRELVVEVIRAANPLYHSRASLHQWMSRLEQGK